MNSRLRRYVMNDFNRQQPSPLLYSIDIWPARNSRLTRSASLEFPAGQMSMLYSNGDGCCLYQEYTKRSDSFQFKRLTHVKVYGI